MKRALIFLQAILLLAAPLGFAQSSAPDTFSPVASYQYQDSFAEPGNATTITSLIVSYQYMDSLDEPDTSTVISSPVVSYQYFDWPGDENLIFTNSANVSYYYNSGPQILTQPVGRYIEAGQGVTLSVSAQGSVQLGYQWRLNGVPIPNATAATLTIPDAQPGNSGNYSVVVHNASGNTTSNAAQITVYLPASTPQPAPPVQNPTTQTLSVEQSTGLPRPDETQLITIYANGTLGANGPNPNDMTIVLTHGWDSDPSMWANMTVALIAQQQTMGAHWNIVEWDWCDQAKTFPNLALAESRTASQGEALGQSLMDALGVDYNQPIHFIGHSLGTLVNCRAADYIHGDLPDSPPKNPGTYEWQNTQMTLLDEAEIAAPINGSYVNSDIQHGNPLPGKVIPDHYAYVDNYISEVGVVHSGAANVLLWRSLAVPGISDFIYTPIFGSGRHGYGVEWYTQTIIDPLPSPNDLGVDGTVMGFFWSFELYSISDAPGWGSNSQQSTFFLQSDDGNASPSAVTILNASVAESINQLVQSIVYPLAQAYLGLNEGSELVESIPGDIQYAGNMAANFAQSFTGTGSQPVYLNTAGSTPAYFTTPTQPSSATPAALWDFQFTIAPGAAQPNQLNIPMLATAIAPAEATPNAVYSIIPVLVPTEAVAMSFQYQITGAGPGDFMTMGIGSENDYTMEAQYVTDGFWNQSPVIQVANYSNQNVQLVFALNGLASLPQGSLSIRNIQFYIPPRPQLQISPMESGLNLSWPLSSIGWTLETTTDLADPNSWQPVNLTPVNSNYFQGVQVDSPTPIQFYRLTK